MGQYAKSHNLIHDAACNLAEAVRQVSAAAAASSPAGQVVVNNAEIAWARACIASCKANNAGNGQEPYINVLKALGVNS
jgi:hypothetical protein